MGQPLNALIVEDCAADADLCVRALRRSGFDVHYRRVETPEDFVAALSSPDWNIVLSDYTMPRFSGMEALRLLRESPLDIPFIVFTGTINEETAVVCLKQGADDYILKENLARLGPAVHSALTAFEDRRERLLLEEQLRHAQRLEMIGTLAGGVAHDFSNLLTAIGGSAELLKPYVTGKGTASKALATIEEAVRQAMGVTRALLTFSHRLPSERQPVDMRAIVEETASLLKRMLPASIELTVEMDREKLLWVDADRIQLQQIILNLAINARDAMKEGGKLTISLTAQNPVETASKANKLYANGNIVRLTVSDNGTGMTEEVRSRVLEPFFTTKPHGEGTGLGLAIVHGIVRNHGGSIGIHSVPGEGSSVTVDLPGIELPSGIEIGRAHV